MTIDIEKLRDDLIDHFGTAMYGGFPMAMMDLSKVERASAEELVRIAKREGFRLSDYKTDD